MSFGDGVVGGGCWTGHEPEFDGRWPCYGPEQLVESDGGIIVGIRDEMKKRRKAQPTVGDQLKGLGRVIRQDGLAGGMSPLAIRRAAKQVRDERGGNSTAFKSKVRGDGKENVFFNRPGDGKNHGHVVQDPKSGKVTYARDEDGNVYVDEE